MFFLRCLFTSLEVVSLLLQPSINKPAALEVKRINVSLEIAQLLRRKARAKRTQKRFRRLMCEQMRIVIACAERFVAMRTLFFVALDLLALVLGALVTSQSTTIRKIFLALIAFVSFLFMNIPNVPQQIALLRKLCLTTTTNKSHLLLCFSLFASESGYFVCFLFLLLMKMKNNKQKKRPIGQSTFLQLLLLVKKTKIRFCAS